MRESVAVDWLSYSAMGNAYAGVVLQGVRDKGGKFSIASLSHAAKLRTDMLNNLNNPAKASSNLGERAGSGLPKIRSGWEDMGNAMRLADSFDPFEQTTLEMNWGRGFSGVLTETPVKTLVKTPEQILEAMKSNAEITVQELAALLGKSESAIHRAIRKLRDAGQIERIGGDKGGHWEMRS